MKEWRIDFAEATAINHQKEGLVYLFLGRMLNDVIRFKRIFSHHNSSRAGFYRSHYERDILELRY